MLSYWLSTPPRKTETFVIIVRKPVSLPIKVALFFAIGSLGSLDFFYSLESVILEFSINFNKADLSSSKLSIIAVKPSA
jgi:hypothetical protein